MSQLVKIFDTETLKEEWQPIPTSSGGGTGKGDKGDPFKYSDFTTEQLALLKGKDGYTPVKGVDYFDGKDATGTGGGSTTVIGGGIPVLFVNVKDAPYNAVGNGIIDDTEAIQKAFDDMSAGTTRNVFIPKGRYKITKPLMVYRWNGSTYDFVVGNIIGESTMWSEQTILNFVFPQGNSEGFGIGVQLGKGVHIEGLTIKGQFVPPNLPDYQQYNLTSETFKDQSGLCKDSRYSPHAGIVFTPFTKDIPADGGYKMMTNFYRGQSNQSGGTNNQVRQCSITGFTVCVITSPNGVTRNEELIFLEYIQFANCKWCLAGTQDQEKCNILSKWACWGQNYGVFCSGKYSYGIGVQGATGNWIIEKGNIAGRSVVFLEVDGGGYFPLWIDKIYSETCGKLGILRGLGMQMSNSIFDWAEYSTSGIRKEGYIDSNANFNNCEFRFYGGTKPMPIKGGASYLYCYFSGMPFNADGAVEEKYTDCGSGTTTGLYAGIGVTRVIKNGVNYMYEGTKTQKVDVQIRAGQGQLTVTGQSGTTTIDLDSVKRWKAGNMVNLSDSGFGIITAVNYTTGDVSIDNLSPSIKTGNYAYFIIYEYLNLSGFLGNIITGENKITEVAVKGKSAFPPLSWWVGNIIYHPYGLNGLGTTQGNRSFVRIDDYDSGTKTITHNGSNNITQNSLIWQSSIIEYLIRDIDKDIHSNGEGDMEEYGPIVLGVGDVIKKSPNSDIEKTWRVTKSGFSSISGTEKRLATLKEQAQ